MDGKAIDARGLLKRFCAEEFDLKVAPMGTGATIRTLIRRSTEYRDARIALDSGLITDSMIRGFVDALMRDFSPGRRFLHETALAAIAALMESHFSPVAEEYLLDLARLKLPEVAHATRTARICLQQRVRFPKTKEKTFRVGYAGSQISALHQPSGAWIARHEQQVERFYAFA